MKKVKFVITCIWIFNILLACATVFFALDKIFLAQAPQELQFGQVSEDKSDQPKPDKARLTLLVANPIQKISGVGSAAGSPQPPAILLARGVAKLKGISLGVPPADRAILDITIGGMAFEAIAEKGKPIIRVDGSPIPQLGGVKLVELRENEAVFEHPGGYRETLSMGLPEAATGLPSAYPRDLRERAIGIETGAVPPPYNPNNYKTRLVAQQPNYYLWEVDPKERDYLQAYQDYILNNQVGVTADPGGGLKLNWAQPGSMALARGLQVGDIVKSVNGIQITSIEKARLLAQDPSLQNAQTIRVQIIRAGTPITIEYRLGRY